MEEINLNEMTTLSEELNVAIGEVNRLRKAQMDFCLKHLVNRCFFSSDENREEYFCFLDALHESRNRVFLHVIRVYKSQDGDLSYRHIEDGYKSFRVIADTFKERLYIETTLRDFEETYSKVGKQISEDVRKFRLDSSTAPKDGISQLEEGE